MCNKILIRSCKHVFLLSVIFFIMVQPQKLQAASLEDIEMLLEKNPEILLLKENVKLAELQLNQYIQNNGFAFNLSFGINPKTGFFTGIDGASQGYYAINPTLTFNLFPSYDISFLYMYYYKENYVSVGEEGLFNNYSEITFQINLKSVLFNEYKNNVRKYEIELEKAKYKLQDGLRNKKMEFAQRVYNLANFLYDAENSKSLIQQYRTDLPVYAATYGNESWEYKIKAYDLENTRASFKNYIDTLFDSISMFELFTGMSLDKIPELNELHSALRSIAKTESIGPDDYKVITMLKAIINSISKNMKNTETVKKYGSMNYSRFIEKTAANPFILDLNAGYELHSLEQYAINAEMFPDLGFSFGYDFDHINTGQTRLFFMLTISYDFLAGDKIKASTDINTAKKTVEELTNTKSLQDYYQSYCNYVLQWKSIKKGIELLNQKLSAYQNELVKKKQLLNNGVINTNTYEKFNMETKLVELSVVKLEYQLLYLFYCLQSFF